jgi:hypothetical protein
MPRLFALAALAALSGCNSYEWFRLTGYVQEGFSNKADILFVVDNSSSMVEEGEALALNISGFIDQFADDDAALIEDPTLTDDVARFLDYLQDRSGNVNYQLGVTTTEASADWGKLLGDNPVVAKTDNNIEQKFNENLLCEAACVRRIPDEVSIDCPNGNPENLRNCADSSTGSREEGIEAVFMAMCRASEDPPEPCFDSWWQDPTNPGAWLNQAPEPGAAPADYFDEDDIGSNEGFLRPGSVVIPVIISDEGDQSRRIESRDGKVFPYDEYFSLFGNRMSWAVIGANDSGGCNTSGAANWGIDRYRRMVASTGGVYIDISVRDGNDCVDADFGAALADIGGLLRSLTSVYPLRATPVPGTIVVTVGGEQISPAEVTFDEVLEVEIFTDGWSYDATQNIVVLHGNAVPDPNEDVRIWYLPDSGAPRDLPF